MGAEQPHRTVAALPGGRESIAEQNIAVNVEAVAVQSRKMRTRQGQPGQAGTDQQHSALEEAASQLNPHRSRNVGKIERSFNPRPMDTHPQRIKTLTAASQHQLPQELGTDGVPGVVRDA